MCNGLNGTGPAQAVFFLDQKRVLLGEKRHTHPSDLHSIATIRCTLNYTNAFRFFWRAHFKEINQNNRLEWEQGTNAHIVTGSKTHSKSPMQTTGYVKGNRLPHGSPSQTSSHNDYIFWKALHFGYFKAAKFAIEVKHLFVYLPDLTKGTMRAWKGKQMWTHDHKTMFNLCHFTFKPVGWHKFNEWRTFN